MRVKNFAMPGITDGILPVNIEWYRYVPHWRRAAYEALGWIFAAHLGRTHGHWAVLMMWAGEGEPLEHHI